MKGDTKWITKKMVRWSVVDTLHQVLTLPQAMRKKLTGSLGGISQRAACISKKKWFRLLGMLRSAVPTIAGAVEMFIRI